MLWSSTFGGATTELFKGLTETASGSIAMIAKTNSFGMGGQDILLVQTDQSGSAMCNSNLENAIQDTASFTASLTFTASGAVGSDFTINSTQTGTSIHSQFLCCGACDLNISVTSTNTNCNGAADGSAIVTATGGTSPYSYSWSNNVANDSLPAIPSGSYSVLVMDKIGCAKNDSTIISGPPAIYDSTATSICSNDSIFLQGAYQNTSAIYYDTLLAVNGCDSIIGTTLAIDSALFFMPNLSICTGDSIIIYGNYQSTANIYYDSLTTQNGCDSILSTALSLDTNYYITDPIIRVCSNDSILIYGVYQNVAGTYYDSSLTINGCDSIHVKTLTIDPSFIFAAPDESICSGDSVIIYGTYRKIAGTYYDSLVTNMGCDSVESTMLIINQEFNTIMSDEVICEGDSISIFGIYRKLAGTFSDTAISVFGCDSITSTTLTVSPLPSVSFSGLNTGYCINSNMATLVGSPSGGTFNGTGVNLNQFDPATAGLGTFIITYTFMDSDSCDDRQSQSVNVSNCTGIEQIRFGDRLRVFPNPTRGIFNVSIDIEGSQNVELNMFDNLGQLIFAEKTSQVQGTYEKQLDYSHYPGGTYNLQLITDLEVFNAQIVIE
ncbi:MAG: T9SS type A sorting domain-containing protein [Flavobacteriales bacterium]|nr:T9SS type A sorting domain-containing protein [Flavobacteriales bacterium]